VVTRAEAAALLRRLTGKQHIVFGASASALLTQLAAPHRRVYAPAYTCESIGQAVGAKLVPVPCQWHSISWDVHGVSWRAGLALPTALFGLPQAQPPSMPGLLVVQDYAHVPFGRVQHTAALFSTTYGKPLSLGYGGVLASDQPLLPDDAHVQPAYFGRLLAGLERLPQIMEVRRRNARDYAGRFVCNVWHEPTTFFPVHVRSRAQLWRDLQRIGYDFNYGYTLYQPSGWLRGVVGLPLAEHVTPRDIQRMWPHVAAQRPCWISPFR
jgi:hypothetical protein